MKIQINNLEELKQFILDEAITPKAKFTVFIEAIRQFKIIVITMPRVLKSQENEAVTKMLSIIESIKEDPAKDYHGTLVVKWKSPYSRAIKAKRS